MDVGTHLGKFEIVGLLGKGGMGEVYLATDSKLGRDVAIKVLPDSFSADPERMGRFEREAQTLASLNHSNVATVYGFEHDAASGSHYLVMEYIDGETLTERIDSRTLSIRDVLEIFIQFARGLDAAHEFGIIHRDLKPDNVKVALDGTVKVIDFGIAKSSGMSGSSAPDAATTPMSPVAITAEGTFMGTPVYMSPEQARGQTVDKRTDLWSFGCCLFEALTHSLPFTGDTVADTVGNILKSDPDWSMLPSDTPNELARVVRRCLEKDVRRRLSSAADCAIALEDLLTDIREGRATSSKSDSGNHPLPDTDPRAIRTIAVLPFENLMGDKEQSYFVYGMTEALTTELSKIAALKVISRGSAMRYKGTDKSSPQIADELGVEGLIEGSVLRADENVRITAQLIDARSDTHVWSDNFTGTMDDIISLQNDVALAVAKAIRVAVTPEEEKRIVTRRPVTREVQKLLWEANYAFNQQNAHGYKNAVRLYKQATEVDPECAIAYVGLAAAHWVPPILGLGRPLDGLERAEEASIRAIELEPESSDALFTAAYLALTYHHNWEESREYFDRAIAISPHSAEARSGSGLLFLAVNDLVSAARETELARELDPMSPMHANNLGIIYMCQGRNEEAISQLTQAVDLSPQFVLGHLNRLSVMVWSRRNPDDLREWESFVNQVDGLPIARAMLAWAYGLVGETDNAQALLRDLEALDDSMYMPLYATGLAYLNEGNLDEGFARIDRAIDEREWMVLYVGTNPFVEKRHRTDPRYVALLEKMNLPESSRRRAMVGVNTELQSPKARATKSNTKRRILAGMVAVLLVLAGFLTGSSRQENTPAFTTSDVIAITSIAVLPFVNQSGKSEQDYFVDGMTSAITSELSKISSLKVIGRASAMHYKDTKLTPKQIAEELGVDGLITGTAIQVDDRVRITAELLDVRSGSQPWSKQYDETMTNVLQVHSDVALAVSEAIQLEVTPDEAARLSKEYDTDPAAYDEFLRGQDRIMRRSESDVRAAIAHFERAVRLDENFAPAYARLADAYSLMAMYWYEDINIAYARAREYAEKAIEIDNDSREGHAALALVESVYTLDMASAERSYKRALEIDPNYGTALRWYGLMLAGLGRSDEALRLIDRLAEVDPGDIVGRVVTSACYYFARDFARASEILEAVLQEHPNHPSSMMILMQLYRSIGEYDKGEKYAKLFLDRTERNPSYVAQWAVFVALSGKTDEARKLLAELESLPDDSFVSPKELSNLYFVLGDDAHGFEYLAQAYGDSFAINCLRVHPSFDQLHDDDRYWKLADDLGLPLLPSDHPTYSKQQEWLAKKALAAQTKPVRRFSINLDPRHPVAPAQYPGNTHDPISFTPEGDAILYTAGVAGKVYLAERALESLETRVIEGTEGGRFPMVSPDGNRITFHADRAYWMMSRQSGTSERLTDGGYVLSAIWENDNSLILSSTNPTFGLQRFDLASREITPLTDSARPTGVILDASISVAADSRILFGIRSTGGTVDTLEVIALDLDGGSIHEVIKAATIPVYVRDGFLVFAQRGRLMASKFNEASMSLKGPVFDVTEPRMVRGNEAPQNFGISPEGTLAYVAVEPAEGTAENGLDIVWVDMEGSISNVDVPISISPNTVFTSTVKGELRIIVNSNDGNLYSLDPTGTYGLNRLTFDQESTFNYFGATDEAKGGILVDVEDAAGNWIERISWQDGSVPERILETQTDELGLFAAYHFDEATNTLIGDEMRGAIFKVTSISLDGAMEIRRVGEPDEFSSDNPALSPDGHWLAYQAKRGERVEVYVTKFPSLEGTWQVSFEGGGQPLWAPDGSKIYYRDGTSVMAADVSLDNGFSVGTPTPLFPDEFFNGTIRRSYDLHPDGTRFLMLKAPDASDVPATEIIVVENWFEVLKEKARAAGALD